MSCLLNAFFAVQGTDRFRWGLLNAEKSLLLAPVLCIPLSGEVPRRGGGVVVLISPQSLLLASVLCLPLSGEVPRRGGGVVVLRPSVKPSPCSRFMPPLVRGGAPQGRRGSRTPSLREALIQPSPPPRAPHKKQRTDDHRSSVLPILLRIASNVSSLMSCSILHASSRATSSLTPSATKNSVSTLCRAYIFSAMVSPA